MDKNNMRVHAIGRSANWRFYALTRERARAGRSAVHSSAEKPRFLPSFLPARADMILGSLRTGSVHSLALVMLE